MLIKYKAEAKRLLAQGAFGNRVQMFKCPDDVPMALRGGLFGVRSMVVGDSRFKTDLPYSEARDLYEKIGNASIYESLPLAWSVWNAEIARTPLGLFVKHITGPGYSCRDVNRPEAKVATGIVAASLVNHYLDAPSRAWLEELLDSYDHPTLTTTVEVTVADRPVGDMGWNSVFWEVRNF